jgi:hypothetical protein
MLTSSTDIENGDVAVNRLVSAASSAPAPEGKRGREFADSTGIDRAVVRGAL